MPFKKFAWPLLMTGVALLVTGPLLAHEKVTKLAEQLLFGDQATRKQAIQDFNKLPADAQYRLVPDFMVALSDDDPEVRKIAGRILKAMGVTTEGQIPDAKKEVVPVTAKPEPKDKWAEEKKMAQQNAVPDAKKELASEENKENQEDKLLHGSQVTGDDKWADLKKMQDEEGGQTPDLQKQLELEKKDQVTLNASELRTESNSATTSLSVVMDSLKDPEPWVRAQAARRLAMIQPAPVEAIPTLIAMLHDKETESRRAAVAALGSFGHLAREAILPLNGALSDPDSITRSLAEESLKQIQQP